MWLMWCVASFFTVGVPEGKQVPRSAYPIAPVGVMGPHSAALGMTE